jgi:hypothetical protein
MPLWLRRTTFNIIKEFYENEAEASEKQQKSQKNGNNKGEVARPNISRPNPTYTTKAAKN